jgi:hypothetical protein
MISIAPVDEAIINNTLQMVDVGSADSGGMNVHAQINASLNGDTLTYSGLLIGGTSTFTLTKVSEQEFNNLSQGHSIRWGN